MAQPYGLLLVGFNCSGDSVDNINERHETQLVREPEHIVGFINTQHWIGDEDPLLSVATCDLESLDVLQRAECRLKAPTNLSAWPKHVAGKCQRVCSFEAQQILPGQQAGPADADGLLLVAMNVVPEVEAEFNTWFNDEHIPLLSAVTGCLCARRFTMTSGTHRYLAVYHLTSPQVQASEAWKKAVGTSWTEKMRPHIRNRLRLVLRRDARTS